MTYTKPCQREKDVSQKMRIIILLSIYIWILNKYYYKYKYILNKHSLKYG